MATISEPGRGGKGALRPERLEPMHRLASGAGRLARPLFRNLGDMFMPRVCVHCRRDRWAATPLCLACLRKVAPFRTPSCRECGLEGCGGSHAVADSPLASMRFLFPMGAELSTLIHGFKYRRMLRHIRFMCAYLRYRPDLAEYAGAFDALVPIPIHPVRKRERGYNQAEKIALEAAPYLGLPVLTGVLRRIRSTESQTKLSRRERGGNLNGAFACVDPDAVHGRRLLLIDDVYTTGATMGRCAELIMAAGAVRVGGMALARVAAAGDRDDFALEMEAVSSYAT